MKTPEPKTPELKTPELKTREALHPSFVPLQPGEPVEWVVAEGLVGYDEAVREMEARAALIADRLAPERVWLVEHPPLYTGGTSARPEDLLIRDRFPIFQTGRGGQFTYHGPGQRVVYLMLDLKRRGADLRAYICRLEAWLVDTLAAFNVTGETRAGRVGVWVRRSPGREDKIAAIGVRVKRWVAYHGISLNVEPDLTHYSGIVPCGIAEHGVTSLVDLGIPVTMAEVDLQLRHSFEKIFATPASSTRPDVDFHV